MLKQMFAKAGTVVDAVVLSDRVTGRSKGFGFVEMGSEDEANKAIQMFHEQDYEGRKMTVNIARPKPEK
jgi:RNA recognition motif-containing protein